MKNKKYDYKTRTKMIKEEIYTDAEISKTTGTPRNQVANQRLELGIPCKRKWSSHEHLLGIEADSSIAKKMGVTANAVTQKRLRMGIDAPGISKEAKMQKAFVETLREYTEQVSTPLGKADIVDCDTIYELKYILTTKSFHTAIGQLVTYSHFINRHKLCIVTTKIGIGTKHAFDVCDKLGISIIVFNLESI